VKFLVDAQLPKRLASYLKAEGHDAIHTLDLPLANNTPDRVINHMSMIEQYVVITKDADFRDSHLLKGEPYKLLLISTGNVKNNDLLRLFEQNMTRIVEALKVNFYVELGTNYVTIHL